MAFVSFYWVAVYTWQVEEEVAMIDPTGDIYSIT